MRQFHVAVAAEAFAAGLLAQAGCDVSVQYGANQPEYDLIASKNDRFLKISVKGSQDGGWGLTQGYKKRDVSYAQAASLWAAAQSPRLVYCFVQFEGVTLGSCPRVYLATVSEIAAHLSACRNGHGSTVLEVNYTYRKGLALGCTDVIPAGWSFTLSRLDELFAAQG